MVWPMGRTPRGVVPEVPGPGQESVWDYPRPPSLERVDCSVQVVLGGVTVCSSDHAWLVRETSHPPTYYLPKAHWRPGSLVPASGSSMCEWKGRAAYYDVVAVADGGQEIARVPSAAWGYPQPTAQFAALADCVSVYPGRMDQVIVDGETVQAQPGDFYGGWITSKVVGPFKGTPGSWGW